MEVLQQEQHQNVEVIGKNSSEQAFTMIDMIGNASQILFFACYVIPVVITFIYVRFFLDMLYPVNQTKSSKSHLKEGENIIGDTNDLASSGVGANPDAVSEKAEMIKLGKEETKRVDIAYPTIALSLTTFAIWVSSFFLFSKGYLHPFVAYVINSIATFVIFTPLHDCTHNAVCPKNKQLNTLIGMISGLPLFAPFSVFRFIHLSHHRYCNDQNGAPDGSSLDPDSFTGQGPWYLQPLNWSVTLAHYILYCCKVLHWRSKDESISPQAREVDKQIFKDIIITMGAFFVITNIVIKIDANAFGICWILPAMTATSFLAYAFDYLPHRPHEIPYKDDPYKSTSMLSIFSDAKAPEFILQIILLNQCYHNIHHLCPWIPFYQYPVIWKNHKEELLKNGTRILPLFLWGYDEDPMSELRATPTATKQEKKTN